MTTVFVSYAREDAPNAKAVAQALEQAGFDVWFDQQLRSGSEYSREIEEALGSASAVLVLWSKNSVNSAWVRDEAAEGRDSGRLVPALLDDCRPPIGFRQFQTADLSHWSGRGKSQQLEDVIAAVRAKAGAPAAPSASTATPGPGQSRRAVRWLAVALGAAMIALGGWFLTSRMSDRAAETPSVALLPFTANSSDADARKLAADAHDAIAHTLSQGAFALRLIDSPPRDGRPPADFIISGQLSSEADKVQATIRMEETAHGSVVFSDQFDSIRKDVGNFAERIGAQVAAQLSWTAPLIAIERRHPSDPAVLAAMLQQRTVVGQNVSALQDYQIARRLALKAPSSVNAQMSLGFNTAFALADIPPGERAEAVELARRATDRARALAPEFGEPYIPWCLLHSSLLMVECEDRLRTAMHVDPDTPFADFFLSQLLENVGRNSEAAQLAQLSLAHDPYMPYKIAQSLRVLETVGETGEANQLYRQSLRWWPANGSISRFRLSGIAQRGDFDAVSRFEMQARAATRPDSVLFALAAKSLGNAQKACTPEAAQGLNGAMCMLALAQLGDPDAAFRLADRLYPTRRGRSAADDERIWLDNPAPSRLAFLAAPTAAALRRDPRYLAVAERVGLLEYWRSGRLPDFCRGARPEPVCEKIRRR